LGNIAQLTKNTYSQPKFNYIDQWIYSQCDWRFCS